MTMFSEIKLNDTIRFVYNAGSSPGVERRVCVDMIDHAVGRLAGGDLSLPVSDWDGKPQYRQFRFECIDQDTLVIEGKPEAVAAKPIQGKRISFVDIQEEIKDCLNDLEPEKLAAMYQELTGETQELLFDDATGDFVVPEKPVVVYLDEMNEDECAFIVYNKDGINIDYGVEPSVDRRTLDFYEEGTLISIEEFVQSLQKHLDI